MADKLIEQEVVVSVNQALKAIDELQKKVDELTGKLEDNSKEQDKNADKQNKNTNETKKQSKELKILSNSLKGAKNSANSLVSSLRKIAGVSFASIVRGASRIGKTLYEMLGYSIDASEQLNMFNVVFGNMEKDGEKVFSDLGLKATRFQNQLNELFSTNKIETLRFQALFQSLAVNTGVQADVAEKMSERMVYLTYDLASLYNKSEEDVAKAIQSGVYAGQTRPMRQVGIDLTQNNMGVTLQELGINDKAVSDLSQAEKQVLRYITAVRSASSANNDFAHTINSPANQLKILKQQFIELSVAIGNLFMRAFANILPYVNAIIMVIKEVLKTIATFFGIETEDYNTAQSSVGDLADGYGDVGDSVNNATKAVKELKRQTLSFDQINNLTTPSKQGSSGGSGSGGGGAIGAIDQRLIDALDKYDLKLDEVHNKAREIRDRIMEWLGFTKEIDEQTGEVRFKFNDINKSSVEIAENFGKKLAEGLNGLMEKVSFGELGDKIANALMTGLTFINTFLEEFDFEKLGYKVSAFFNHIFENVNGEEIGKALTQKIRVAFDFAYAFVTGFDWKDFGITVGDAINGAINNIDLSKIVKTIQTTISGIFDAGFRAVSTIDVSALVDNIEGAIQSLNLGKIGKSLSDFLMSIVDFCIEFLEEIDWVDTFYKLGEQIVAFVASIDWGGLIMGLLGVLWSAIKGLFEALGGLIVGIIENIAGLISGDVELEDLIDDVEVDVDRVDKKVDEFKEKLKELRKESKENYDLSNGQIIVTENLVEELGKLTDENGKVKESEKTRAKVIIGQLNDALGTELSLGDDLILKNGKEKTSYKNVKEEIEKLIKVRRANALMKAYEDEYAERLKQLSKDQAEYNDLVQKYGENATGEHKKRMDELERHISKNQSFVTSFENMQYLVTNGFNEMDREQMKMVKDWERNSDTSLQNIMYSSQANQKYMEESARIHRQTMNTLTLGHYDQIQAGYKYAKEKVRGFKDDVLGYVKDMATGKIDIKTDLKKGKGWNTVPKDIDSLDGTHTATVDVKETSKTKSFFDKLKGIGGAISSFFSGGKAEGGIYVNGSWKPVQQYASGGLPSTGQLFMAREAGPELVGKIGNATAVMNNNQIVSSVASGVAQAVKGVMAGGSGGIEVYVHTDEGVVVDRINRITKRTGECPIQI